MRNHSDTLRSLKAVWVPSNFSRDSEAFSAAAVAERDADEKVSPKPSAREAAGDNQSNAQTKINVDENAGKVFTFVFIPTLKYIGEEIHFPCNPNSPGFYMEN